MRVLLRVLKRKLMIKINHYGGTLSLRSMTSIDMNDVDSIKKEIW